MFRRSWLLLLLLLPTATACSPAPLHWEDTTPPNFLEVSQRNGLIQTNLGWHHVSLDLQYGKAASNGLYQPGYHNIVANPQPELASPDGAFTLKPWAHDSCGGTSGVILAHNGKTIEEWSGNVHYWMDSKGLYVVSSPSKGIQWLTFDQGLPLRETPIGTSAGAKDGASGYELPDGRHLVGFRGGLDWHVLDGRSVDGNIRLPMPQGYSFHATSHKDGERVLAQMTDEWGLLHLVGNDWELETWGGAYEHISLTNPWMVATKTKATLFNDDASKRTTVHPRGTIADVATINSDQLLFLNDGSQAHLWRYDVFGGTPEEYDLTALHAQTKAKAQLMEGKSMELTGTTNKDSPGLVIPLLLTGLALVAMRKRG